MKFQIGHKINKGRTPWSKGKKAKDDNRIKKFVEAGINFHKGKSPWNKGLTKKDPRILKIALAKIGKKRPDVFGENHWNWKNGVSKKKGYDSFISSRRKARKLKNGGSHTFFEWENLKAQYNWTCPNCHLKEPFENQKYKFLTEDHIISLEKGGSDNIENIQPLCFSCNSRKFIQVVKYVL